MQYEPLRPEKAIEMIQFIPSRPDYETWTRVISSIANYYDFNTAVSILKSRFADETINETEIKIKNRLRSVGIGTFIYYAKKYGYMANKTATNRRSYDLRQKAIRNYNEILKPLEKPENSLKLDISELREKKPLFKALEPLNDFQNEVVNEYMKTGLSKLESVSKVIESCDMIKKERAYYVSANKHILNKNLNPNTLQKYGYIDNKTNQFKESFSELNNNFKSYIATSKEMIRLITDGNPLIFCKLKKQPDGTYNRKSENFLKSNCFGIDIDGGLSIESALKIPETRKALFLYTSPSHTESAHRFRIVFGLPFIFESDKTEHLKEIIKHYISIYGADKQCSDLTRIFYGNNNTTVYNIQTGEISQYKRGTYYE